MNSSFQLILLGLVAILATRVESLPAATTKSEILLGTSDNEPGHIINKRAIQCSNSVPYGSTEGTSFTDFPGNNSGPCGVDITEISVFALGGNVLTAIQVTYKTLDGVVITGPRHGGSGGTQAVLSLEDGERITGATGMICDVVSTAFVHQLVFFSEKADGQKSVHGPYGLGVGTNCFPFAVNAKIDSIFGRVTTRGNFVGLGAIGYYYEDTGSAPQSTSRSSQ